MANISLALTTLGLPVRAGFLLVAAALWLVFAPTFHVCVHIYAQVVSLPLTIAARISQGNMPEGHVTSLATNYLSQRRAVSGPWSLLRSVFEQIAGLGLLYFFVVYYGVILTMNPLMPLYILLDWALQPLWRGFRDWSSVRAIAVEVVVFVSGSLVDLQYVCLQNEWREDSSSSPSLQHTLFTTMDLAREQVWLISLSSSVLNVGRGLGKMGSHAVEDFMRRALESPNVPSLVKTPLSALIVTVSLAEDGLRKKCVEKWGAMFTKPASTFVSEVHSRSQESKHEQNLTIYEPLTHPTNYIRILRILPGIEGQAIQCFVHAEQRSSARYEALSYVWGDPTLQRFITLNGTRYSVGKNVYECLAHLRRATTERKLWVDTLCINQADPRERSDQVLLMGDLYKKAEQVVVWLGLEVKGVQELFYQASDHHEADPNEAERSSHSRNLDAAQHLLGSPWWSRVWTVQELILGSSTIVQCGKHSLPWESFCQVIDWGASHMDRADREKTSYSQYLALKHERELYRQHVGRRFPLLERMYKFRGKQASVPVDKIFGFYGLLDEPWAEIIPQYNLHPSLVEQSFAIDFINRFKSLAVIAVAELLTPKNAFPARWQWYPRWKRDGSTSPITLFWTGLGDEIGGQPWSEEGFDAAHGQLVRTKIHHPEPALNYQIELEGWHMDTVELASAVIASEDVDCGRWEPILEQWLGMAYDADGATDGGAGRNQKLRLFYKTITAGMFDDEQPPESLQRAKFVAAFQSACRCRRLFFTSSGHYGLGPEDTACGDEIWVLLGMAVPVVLGRRVRPSEYGLKDDDIRQPDPDEAFRYLGQAYIDELMRPANNTAPVTGLSEQNLENVQIWSRGG